MAVYNSPQTVYQMQQQQLRCCVTCNNRVDSVQQLQICLELSSLWQGSVDRIPNSSTYQQ
jgi:hypothetical protein